MNPIEGAVRGSGALVLKGTRIASFVRLHRSAAFVLVGGEGTGTRRWTDSSTVEPTALITVPLDGDWRHGAAEMLVGWAELQVPLEARAINDWFAHLHPVGGRDESAMVMGAVRVVADEWPDPHRRR